MVTSWEDTWKEMYGIVDVWWDMINMKILSSKENFLSYMQDSSQYQNASEDERAQLMYEWEEMYDNWIKAQDTSAVYYHDDSWQGLGASATSKKSGSSSSNKTKATTSTPGTVYSGEKMEAPTQTIAQQISTTVKTVVNTVSGAISSLFSNSKKNASGGLVDYTGFTWVDGTKANPEAFLSASDTKMIRKLLDAFSFISLPSMTRYDAFNNSTRNNIGDIYVTINEADFKDDADYEEVAKRVGDAFARELEKQGFSTVSYSL